MKSLFSLLLAGMLFTACKKDTAKPVETACSKFSLEGIWTRTESGPNGDPACLGEKIEYKNGKGIIVYEPAGCKFIVGDTKWSNLSLSKCTIWNSYFADPTLTTFIYQAGAISFVDMNKVMIHGVTYTK